MENQPSGRRAFIKKTGLLSIGIMVARFPVWGSSVFAAGYPKHNIPAEKNIDPKWIATLYKRSTATAYKKSKNELRYIGMPVGGLHAGTVYVGGDGRLWLWQIYNETFEGAQEGIEPKIVNWNDGTTVRKIRPRDGSAYIEPAIADNKRILDQGFALKTTVAGKTIIKELSADHWDEVIFTGSYPLADIVYTSKDFPLEVRLKVYSPFIPLDAEKSALPATILRVQVLNNSTKALPVDLIGWMENGVNKVSGKPGSGSKTNTVSFGAASVDIVSGFTTTDVNLSNASDHGSMCFTYHGNGGKANPALDPWPVETVDFNQSKAQTAKVDGDEKLVGGISLSQMLAPGKTMQADYSISWHFNNVNPKLKKLVKDAEQGYHYASRFKDARAVSDFIKTNFNELTSGTELWNNTWNSSTLPHWFLERTFLNIGTLATANTYRFASGRFWSWEGVGACAGTCTHVWQYAHAMARIFPSLERDLRERVDLGIGFVKDTGAIIFRGENETRPAIDGQAGTILRFYREHQMNRDDAFLKTNWAKIKLAVQFMLAQDKNGDGMTDTPMENTLDAVWEGEIAWIVGLCIAAASAAQAMATEVGDTDFAALCKAYVEKGRNNMERELFNGEYFIHRPDAVQGRKKLGSYNTCHIDQVYGQSWAFQVGLPRVLDEKKTRSALHALWKYNFTMDVGPYIKTHIGGRPYALSGEGGMVMNTNPHNEEAPFGEDVSWQLGYFHECMSGFEHQVAAHMMAEGMHEESLILTNRIHDRYHAAKRNPYNEIECSDHYARAMASYGTYLSACGFSYHGPKGIIGFGPKWNKENFAAAFTAAEGWGSYRQKLQGSAQVHQLQLKYGTLRLNEIRLEKIAKLDPKRVKVNLMGKIINAVIAGKGEQFNIRLAQEITIQKGQTLEISIS
ncbi:GH116 family glycosyl hydrolase [Pedobacter kyungheensis]|uniref:GH116 family glycosyl hydrolase n=1 Tax=Pedobacter kyungheensis TaxID=1069985 RepID=UPI00068B1E80|nr:GH116 family glycosyl hydrolase [Pedobacter kyungheensis]